MNLHSVLPSELMIPTLTSLLGRDRMDNLLKAHT